MVRTTSQRADVATVPGLVRTDGVVRAAPGTFAHEIQQITDEAAAAADRKAEAERRRRHEITPEHKATIEHLITECTGDRARGVIRDMAGAGYRTTTIWTGDLAMFECLDYEVFRTKVKAAIEVGVEGVLGRGFSVRYSDERCGGSHAARQGRDAAISVSW